MTPTPIPSAGEKLDAETLERRLHLWFFRDLSNAQRLGLFNLSGYPVDELQTHAIQQLSLRNLINALSRRSLETAVGVERPSYDAISAMVHACRERQKTAGEGDQMLSRWISEGLDGLFASRTPNTEVVVKAFVADYLKSDGTTDYYVMLGSDGREMSLHMHRIRGRAEYEAAEINHVISGSPKPEFDDFDVDGPALTSPPSPAQVTDEQIAAGKVWFDQNFNGCPDTETLVEGILRAALQDQPSKGA